MFNSHTQTEKMPYTRNVYKQFRSTYERTERHIHRQIDRWTGIQIDT